jgi:hypothetical protein
MIRSFPAASATPRTRWCAIPKGLSVCALPSGATVTVCPLGFGAPGHRRLEGADRGVSIGDDCFEAAAAPSRWRRRARSPPWATRAAWGSAYGPLPAPTTPPGPGQPVEVVFLGRIGDRKGTFRLLDAWAQLDEPAATLTIGGDGEVERAPDESVNSIWKTRWRCTNGYPRRLWVNCSTVPRCWRCPRETRPYFLLSTESPWSACAARLLSSQSPRRCDCCHNHL